MSNPNDANIVVDGQKVIATVAQSGTVVKDGGEIDATSVIQTDSGLQKAVKVMDVNGGGGGGSSTNIVTLTTESTELATNTIYNGGELASVTLTLPNSVPVDFIAQVEFTSGATATTETVAGQILNTKEGTNSLTITQASLEGLTLEARYKRER